MKGVPGVMMLPSKGVTGGMMIAFLACANISRLICKAGNVLLESRLLTPVLTLHCGAYSRVCVVGVAIPMLLLYSATCRQVGFRIWWASWSML